MPRFRMSMPLVTPNVTVRRAVCDGCDPAQPCEEHAHEPALWLVTAGAFELRARSGTHVVDPSVALLLAPGAAFVIRHPAGPDVCLALRGPLVAELATDGARTVPIDAHTHAAIVTTIGDGDEDALSEALAMIAGTEPPTTAAASHRRLAERLAHAVRLTYAEPRTLEEVARDAGSSLFHACRVFRHVTGHSLHGYRRELRLRHALAALLDGDASLAAIAAETGFATQSHLTNAFRARFGSTPGRVRAERRLLGGRRA